MTTEDIENLIEQWDTDSAQPVLADPWERTTDSGIWERERNAVFRGRPDLGWTYAGRVARGGRQCPLLMKPEFRWIRAAVQLLTNDAKATRHLREVEAVSRALELYKSDAARPVLNAVLMTSEASVALVSMMLKIRHSVLSAYADLFFNVLDRKEDLVFLQTILKPGKDDHCFVSKSSLPSEEELLLAAGFTGTIADVLRIAGWTSGEEEESEEDLLKRVKRNVLKNGSKLLESPAASKHSIPSLAAHAIELVKKAQIEQPTSNEDIFPGDFGSMARAILTGDATNLRRSIDEKISAAAPDA